MQDRPFGSILVASLLLLGLLGPVPARAELPVESTGQVVTLPAPAPHWAWVADPLLRRSTLVDLDRGKTLGMVSAGFGPIMPMLAAGRGEVMVAETHYSRGSRGERTDVLTLYDMRTLAPTAEVVLPPKRAISAVPSNHATLTDDERFAVVFNLTPAASISVVDLAERRLAGEIATPGCSLVYAVSGRRIAMLCLDGALLVIALDEGGGEASRKRSAPFFDPQVDPITEKGVRIGDRWLFASFEGYLHEVDLSGEVPAFAEPWSLFDDGQRSDEWRIGGAQHLALHRKSGRLFALMHQGGVDTHKESGSEVWVYDLAGRKLLQRIELESPGLTIMGFPIEVPEDWIWPLSSIASGIVNAIGSAMGGDEIRATQDETPLLAVTSNFGGGIALYDALTGDFLRRIYSGNMTNVGLIAPFGGQAP
ncbi:MAG: amine dehydrogenase [Deltaproteobacteria bacterium]|nr:amine dehydrogenase [Deltaproteobacteria bacterium]